MIKGRCGIWCSIPPHTWTHILLLLNFSFLSLILPQGFCYDSLLYIITVSECLILIQVCFSFLPSCFCMISSLVNRNKLSNTKQTQNSQDNRTTLNKLCI